MPKIEIVEYDQTLPGKNADSTDVVYIPGFVDVQSNFQDPSKALPMNTPTLFTDITQFESLCGTKGAVFETAQYYKDVGGLASGFAEVAVPYSGIMFEAGTVDPGYVMAKELLSAGLNVLYERVNPDSESNIVKSIKPADWGSNYEAYQVLKTAYKDIVAPRMPEMMTIQNGAKYDHSKTYYERIIKDGKVYFKAVSVATEDISDGVIASKSEASKIYYVPSDTEYYLVSEVAAETDYAANKYFVKDSSEKDNLGYKLITDAEAPESWPQNAYVLTKQALTTQTIETDTQVQGFTEEWRTNWSDAVVKQEVYVTNSNPAFDITATYKIDTPNISIKIMYSALSSIFDASSDSGLMDRGNYSFKYITSGGYPVYEYNDNEIVTKMMNVAATRGDCVAIIDHTDNPNRDDNIDHFDSIYQTVIDDVSLQAHGEFATMFTPWATYNRQTIDKLGNKNINAPTSIRMPASYAYLLALADSIKTNANWLAIAGSARGTVLNLAQDGMTTNIPNGAADRMQPRDGVAINPITNINPYGYVIWGNRTLKNNGVEGNLTATSFLNIRNLVSDVKKVCYRAARKLTFEQNNDILWINFKSIVNPILDTMMSGYGISGYKLVIDNDKLRELGNPKSTLCVKIILYPVYAVEDFYISIVLKDDETTVEEA